MRLCSLLLSLAFTSSAPAFAQGPTNVTAEHVSGPAAASTAEDPAAASAPATREEVRPARPAPTPLVLPASPEAHHVAYAEAFRILSEDNPCSRFFGGAGYALDVLNRMAARMRARPLGDPTTCVVMRGDYTIIKEGRTGGTFRVFEEVTVNSAGPLSFTPPPATLKMTVGSFPARTKRGWVLVLLHEVGHLVRGPQGRWLLPNDGGDELLSRRNTRLVESHCLGQLTSIRE